MSENEKLDNRNEAERLKELGNQAFREGSYHSAIELYSQAIRLVPEEVTYYNNRATASFLLNRFQNALDDSKIALSKDNANIKAHIRAGKCFVRMGDLKRAREHFQKAIAFDSQPSNPLFKDLKLLDEIEGYERKARAFLDQQDFVTAGVFIDKIMTECFKSVTYRTMKLRVHLGKKEYLEASNLAGELLRENDDNPEVIFLRGRAHYYTGNFEFAIKHYTRALHMDPDLPGAGVELKKVRSMEAKKKEANEAFSAKKHQEAYDLYSELLSIDPTNEAFNSTIYCNRAAAAMQIGKFAEAAEDCTKSIELNQDYTRAYKRRANIYMKLEKYQEAINDYEKYKEMDPTDGEIKHLLSDAKLELKKSKRKDYYKILGIAKDADEKEIKRGYRLAAMKWHPDKNKDNMEEAEVRFKEVGEAYAVLSDPQKKDRYDSGVDLEDMGQGGVDVNDIFSQFFGGAGGGGRSQNFHFGGFPAQGGFSTSFTGGGGRRGGFPF